MPLAPDIQRAITAKAHARPRSAQVRLGPSELGQCREYVRNVMIGTPQQPDPYWPAAAEIGTMIGDYVEEAAKEHLGALTQMRVTTTLPNGLRVSGTADMVFPDRNLLADCKSKDDLVHIRKEGPSVENLIQVSVYTLGLVQMGVLTEGATASLIYVDRSGKEQTVYEVELEWETILAWVDRCVDRLNDVLIAQEHIDQGQLEWAHALRDKTPPYCYHERVMCPFRDLCWEGSEWVPTKDVLAEDVAKIVHEFVEARQAAQDADALRKAYREALIGIHGITEEGWSVNWPGDGRALYVTKVKGTT